MEREQQLKFLKNWINDQFKKNDVPKFSQVLDFAYREMGYKNLKPIEIKRLLRLQEPFQMTSPQQRKRLRGNRHRPILVNDLGFLHADIGFFKLVREHETPKRFQAGFLIAKDVLSRFTYVSVLQGDRKAPTIEKAFNDIFRQFRKQNDGLHVKSVSFDQERSIMSHKMQDFFKRKKVAFHAFQNTASKSKMAESAIRLVRHVMAVMKDNPNNKELRWWHLIQPAVDVLNSQPIEIGSKFLKFPDQYEKEYYAPKDVNKNNVQDFISKLHKAAPSYYHSQFDISRRFVKFRFNVGDLVRVKLIVTSSEVIGTKRSELTLNKEIFEIKEQLPYVSKALTIEKAYVCKSTLTGDTDVFDEEDLAEAPNPSQNGN